MIFTMTMKVLPSEPGGPDEWQKLRRLLKTLLRSFGCRLIRIEREEDK